MSPASLLRLGRPEYVWQPTQLLRRAWRTLRRTNTRESADILLPWGFPITVDPRESIGRSIVALNILDLSVTESIWRLLDPGETCADIGANIGYMTSLMAARLRTGGRVLAFEPVPLLANILRRHADTWRPLTSAQIEVHETAVSVRTGTALIQLPDTFALNRGQASLSSAPPPGTLIGQASTLSVKTVRLDEVVARDDRMSLIKIDVEGFELEVLHGADALLRRGAVRDIVFEEHGGSGSASIQFLRASGFDVFRVLRFFSGPKLVSPTVEATSTLEAPTYLATTDVKRARARFAARGWLSLRAKVPRSLQS
jgi:FkbM family methyltransferase